MFNNINWERRIEDEVQALYRAYGADSSKNDKRQRKVVEYCLNDIESHPQIKATLLHSKNNMKYYILQCALECVEEGKL